MMLNLFSIFDPCTIFFSLNWISSFICLIFFPQIYWLKFSNNYFILIKLFNLLLGEFKVILFNKFNLNNIIYFVVLFMFILFNNFMGLFSYIFTSSSHLIFSLGFSLIMWNSYMLFGWLKNTKFMLVHMLPQGTPLLLMNFMVLIETLSMIIRPMTLSVRLTANMIAGHLLLTLLSSFIPDFIFMYFIVLLMQIMLLILEIAVSFIQSYVFILLTVLYLKETN